MTHAKCVGCEMFKPVAMDKYGDEVCEDCDPELHAQARLVKSTQARLVKSKGKIFLIDENLRGLL